MLNELFESSFICPLEQWDVLLVSFAVGHSYPEIEISENTDEIYGTNPAFRIQVVFPLYNYFIPSWLVLYIDISKNNFFHPELKCFL